MTSPRLPSYRMSHLQRRITCSLLLQGRSSCPLAGGHSCGHSSGLVKASRLLRSYSFPSNGLCGNRISIPPSLLLRGRCAAKRRLHDLQSRN